MTYSQFFGEKDVGKVGKMHESRPGTPGEGDTATGDGGQGCFLGLAACSRRKECPIIAHKLLLSADCICEYGSRAALAGDQSLF